MIQQQHRHFGTSLVLANRHLMGAIAGAGNGDGGNGYEDFTAYTLVDAETNYTVTPTKITVADIHPEHATSYLYYDFGAGYFKTNVKMRFALNVSAIWTANALYGIVCLANDIGTLLAIGQANGGPDVQINYDYDGDGSRFEVHVGALDHVSHSYMDHYLVGANVYYFEFDRTYVGSDANEVGVTPYADSGYTTPLKALVGGAHVGSVINRYYENDVTDVNASKTFRYLVVGVTSRDDWTETEVGSCYIENLEITENSD